MEHVNHPKHYNQHPAGIECIDIIRHYTCDIANAIKYLWRAGLKPEMGKEDAEKEIEDLKKALWYIEDFIVNEKLVSMYYRFRKNNAGTSAKDIAEYTIYRLSGHSIDEITKPYTEKVADAMRLLLIIGVIDNDGKVYLPVTWMAMLNKATDSIQSRILDIECSLTEKELKETVDVLHGYAVDGEDYVSKPGCVRETEPEKYDPLNMVVAWGRVYSLTDEVRQKKNGALYSPCENCDLWSECHDWHDMPNSMLDESKCHYLCARIHNANDQQYYREVGVAKYSPKFGTVEVVDELKESELELRELEKTKEQ